MAWDTCIPYRSAGLNPSFSAVLQLSTNVSEKQKLNIGENCCLGESEQCTVVERCWEETGLESFSASTGRVGSLGGHMCADGFAWCFRGCLLVLRSLGGGNSSLAGLGHLQTATVDHLKLLLLSSF